MKKLVLVLFVSIAHIGAHLPRIFKLITTWGRDRGYLTTTVEMFPVLIKPETLSFLSTWIMVLVA